MIARYLLVALTFLGTPALAAAQAQSPYADQYGRAIKALSPDDRKGYLAGDGLGFAKAAELNHYPGPRHVLAMADRLALTSVQRQRIEAIARAMTTAAVPLGRQIIAAEGAFDRRFANGTIDEVRLRSATAQLGALQGRLRDVHLRAHLATRDALTHEQVVTYDNLRGYDAQHAEMHHHGS